MSANKIATVVVVFSLITADEVIAARDRAGAQAKPPDTSQQTKPETKIDAMPATAASLAGKWTITVNSPVGARPFWIELKVDPKDATKLTGTISTLVSTDAVEGEVVGDKLTFGFNPVDPAGARTVRITFVGTLQKDGSLAGTLNTGPASSMPWTAVREKKQAQYLRRLSGRGVSA